MKNKYLALFGLTSASLALPLPALAADDAAFKGKFELRINYRDSADEAFAAPFPPGSFISTVDPGGHLEISNFTFHGKAQLSENWQVITKLDAEDKYERNPTTSDKKADVDLFIVRYGTRHTQGVLPENVSWYGQIGKFGKFERQEDRHLESYGLVSTAFNRLEDSGLEFGIDLPSGFYAKLSYTTGSPLFFRDPNALAGDNGVEFQTGGGTAKYNSGVVMLYDAEVEDFDLSENPEVSTGLGYRWLSDSGETRVNVLLHHNKRDLADTIELHGTGYGGDLDLLEVQPNELPPGTIASTVGLPIDGDTKEEAGLTVWFYQNNLALFAQMVQQDIAGLERDGWEIEASYMFSDVIGSVAITPAIRYSTIDNDFATTQPYPAASVMWDWNKIDVGVNVDFNKNVRLTVEHAINDFERAGKSESNDETLVTLLLQKRL